MNKRIISYLFLFTLAQMNLSSCSLLKASQAKDAGFLPRPELLKENRERAPFHGYWAKDERAFESSLKRKAKIYIAAIDTSIVEKMYLEASGDLETKTDRIEEARELANYFINKLKLVADSNKEVVFSTEAKDDSYTLNLSLVQIIPTKPGVNLAGTIAGSIFPGGGLIKHFGEGSVAMEGFVDDKKLIEEEKLWIQFKDREGQKTSPFSFKDYRRYAHIRVALDDWAMQIVELLTTSGDHKVENSSGLRINPL